MTPMALCTLAMSNFAGMNEMVASPGVPPGTIGGMKNLMTESGFRSENGRKEWTMRGLKNFIPLTFLAAAGSANMVVIGDVGSNCRSVASWQWSDLSCDMRTTFGSGICDRCGIQDGLVCFDRRNFGCHIVVGPESHGSTSIEKVPGGC